MAMYRHAPQMKTPKPAPRTTKVRRQSPRGGASHEITVAEKEPKDEKGYTVLDRYDVGAGKYK